MEKVHKKSALICMKKEKLSDLIIMLEHNSNVLHETLDTQAANYIKLTSWIPVEEQLPEPHVDVLVSFMDFEEDTSTFIDCLVDNNGRLTWSTYNGAKDKVLAWMPLPEPYQLGRCDERCKTDVTSCNKWDTNKCKLHPIN